MFRTPFKRLPGNGLNHPLVVVFLPGQHCDIATLCSVHLVALMAVGGSVVYSCENNVRKHDGKFRFLLVDCTLNSVLDAVFVAEHVALLGLFIDNSSIMLAFEKDLQAKQVFVHDYVNIKTQKSQIL